MIASVGHDAFFPGAEPLTDLAASDLEAIYPKPSPRVIAKARPEIDAHAKKFIKMPPFCVLATSGSDGSVDASPRGGNPGFVNVAGPNRLLLPDRSGNNRIDSFRNIVEGSGFVQLIFFVPGIDETLRVGGKGRLLAEPELLASMEEFGKLPRAEPVDLGGADVDVEGHHAQGSDGRHREDGDEPDHGDQGRAVLLG